jgi:hypothetical protein
MPSPRRIRINTPMTARPACRKPSRTQDDQARRADRARPAGKSGSGVAGRAAFDFMLQRGRTSLSETDFGVVDHISTVRKGRHGHAVVSVDDRVAARQAIGIEPSERGTAAFARGVVAAAWQRAREWLWARWETPSLRALRRKARASNPIPFGKLQGINECVCEQ